MDDNMTIETRPETGIKPEMDRYKEIEQQTTNYLSRLQRRLSDHFPDLQARRKIVENNWPNFEVSEIAARSNEFIKESDEWCALWQSEQRLEDGEFELQFYGDCVVLVVKCIDGRMPRATEGEAESLKTEASLMATEERESDGKLRPRQDEVRRKLRDTTKKPLEVFKPHFCSDADGHKHNGIDEDHSCAAMGIILSSVDSQKAPVWKRLTADEVKLVLTAAESGSHYANQVLVELINKKAVSNVVNDARVGHGLEPLARVAVTESTDTRTMGLEVNAPLIQQLTEKHQRFVPPSEQSSLSTTQLCIDLEDSLADVTPQALPEFGYLGDSYTTKEKYLEYSRAKVQLAAKLFDPDRFIKDVHGETDEYKQVKAVSEQVHKYFTTNFPDLVDDQSKALRFRFCFGMAHQIVTGLHRSRGYHKFSDHEEYYGSMSRDANYPGKFVLQRQSIRFSYADEETAAKRLALGSLVIDRNGKDWIIFDDPEVKGQKPHIFYASASINYNDWKQKKEIGFSKASKAYDEKVREVGGMIRGLIHDPEAGNLIYGGRVVIVPVLIAANNNGTIKAGQVLEVLEDLEADF